MTEKNKENFKFAWRITVAHVICYFEAIIWISLFVGIIWTFYKFEKNTINITAVVLFVLIVLMSIAGYFAEYLSTLQTN